MTKIFLRERLKQKGRECQSRPLLTFISRYSPELNPKERLDADLKHAISTKGPLRAKAKLKVAATEHMQTLENHLNASKILPEFTRKICRLIHGQKGAGST